MHYFLFLFKLSTLWGNALKDYYQGHRREFLLLYGTAASSINYTNVHKAFNYWHIKRLAQLYYNNTIPPTADNKYGIAYFNNPRPHAIRNPRTLIDLALFFYVLLIGL
jgi:hypothetical protein